MSGIEPDPVLGSSSSAQASGALEVLPVVVDTKLVVE